jgi:hypothetical protein
VFLLIYQLDLQVETQYYNTIFVTGYTSREPHSPGNHSGKVTKGKQGNVNVRTVQQPASTKHLFAMGDKGKKINK